MKRIKFFRLPLLYLVVVMAWGVAIASPPPAPQLIMDNQGLNVSLAWQAVEGATGYRLFYSTDISKGVESIDLGTATSFSTSLWDGASFYVAIVAYNDDGVSPYSNVENLQAFDPSKIDSKSLALQFKSVEIDTPVAFLPEENSTETSRAARSVSAQAEDEITEIDYEDGVIGMSVQIAPGMVTRENLPLSFCLDVGVACEPLPVWNSDEKTYADSLIVSKVSNNVETSLYLEFKLPDSLVEKLRPQLSQPTTYTIRATLLDSPNTNNIGVELAQVTLVDLPSATTRKARDTVAPSIGVKFGKEYSKKFANSYVGVEFKIGAEAMAYNYTAKKPKEGTSTSARTGALVQAKGAVTPSIWEQKIDLVSSTNYVILEDEHPLHAHFDIKALGAVDVFVKNYRYDEKAENKFRELSSDEVKTMPTPPAEDDIKGMKFIELGSQSKMKGNLVSVPLGGLFPAWQIKKGAEKRFIIGFIPLKVELSAAGKLEVAGKAGLKYSSKEELMVFGDMIGPKVSVKVEGKGGVDFLVAEGGVKATLTLIANTLGANAALNLERLFKEGKGMEFSIVNQLDGPSGDISLYVEWQSIEVSWFSVSFKPKKLEKELLKWESFSKKYTLYEVSSDNSEKSSTEMTDTGKSSGQVPEYRFTDAPVTSRPDTNSPWACFYQHINFEGKSLCLPLPKDLGIVSFPLSDAVKEFNDNISSFKIWGDADYGIQITLFQHGDYTGDQMIYVTHSEEAHADFNGVHPSINLNDTISSIVMQKAQPKLGSWPSLPSNVEQWGAGYCLWEHINFEGKRDCSLDSKLFQNTTIGRNQASSIKVWAALGGMEVYFATQEEKLSGLSKLRGTLLGVWLQAGEYVELNSLGYANKLYLNDDLIGAIVRFREGEMRSPNWDIKH